MVLRHIVRILVRTLRHTSLRPTTQGRTQPHAHRLRRDVSSAQPPPHPRQSRTGGLQRLTSLSPKCEDLTPRLQLHHETAVFTAQDSHSIRTQEGAPCSSTREPHALSTSTELRRTAMATASVSQAPFSQRSASTRQTASPHQPAQPSRPTDQAAESPKAHESHSIANRWPPSHHA